MNFFIKKALQVYPYRCILIIETEHKEETMQNIKEYIEQRTAQTSKEMRDLRNQMDEITKEIIKNTENELRKYFERR